MKKLNPIERSEYINRRYREYLRSSFSFSSPRLQTLYEKQLEEEELFKGPYVALDLPFQRGKSLQALIDEGTLCKSFSSLGDMDFERPLYLHQEEAIRKIGAGRGAIVTTGTGSGKTESFLYPVLNEILRDIESGVTRVGIPALFLYPMNALVNDQIDRVRKILTGYPEITFGFFTGETEESVSSNYRAKFKEETGIHIPENELVSREEIRQNPPDLLFTNYSMLEYLLIRPNDYAILSPERLHNWKFVVLDEAHSYHGSLGIELSMLMRRLTGLAVKKPRFILTSATLGQKGESEEAIVEFAVNLTSSEFKEDDIIFAKRIPLYADMGEYAVAGTDYILLKENLQDTSRIHEICQKYKPISSSNNRECLFELLYRDQNVYHLYQLLAEESKNIYQLLSVPGFVLKPLELLALIDLINLAEKNGIDLFSMKYHSFVRPLSGAFVTIEEHPRLSLTKTNYLEGMKAFEVGNCKYCQASYIIGKKQINSNDGLEYLYQNKEVDIYENYGNNEYVQIDYFLFDDKVAEDSVEKSALEEHIVCGKCGAIRPAKNLNGKSCVCGSKYELKIYEVLRKKDSEGPVNNISKCPCCTRSSKSGVVRGLNLGKDEGTAFIAQTLYEAIDDSIDSKKKPAKLSLKPKGLNGGEKQNSPTKQFLSFSDSRQQASFAAVFLDANHVRMLRKRLIWKIIEDHGYQDIGFDEFASHLSKIIKENNLFPNEMTAHKNAWVTLLVDLMRIDGVYDGEGLGLYYFDLDLSELLSLVDEGDIEEAFGKYQITKQDLGVMMQVVFDAFKTTPAINYTKSTLTPEEKIEYLEFRRFDNSVMFLSQKGEKGIRSFLPMSGNGNVVVRYVQKVCSCGEDAAKEILDILFNNLAADENVGIFKKHPQKEAYQIEASRYIVKNYKTSKFYRCSKCGRVTPYNVHNVCIQDKCDGSLVEVDPDVIFENNYYRKQYKTKKVESIVIKEHTAQLDRKTAKQYQKDFKEKKINILSCSTTFEMGIDIGNLETVYMRNVPPTPANYVQRAGRAGRRKDTSAYVLTYCGTGSHDYTYFTAPEKMISGVIKPPYFDVQNRKIIERHLMATCLGFFFRQHPEYFNSVDELIFGDGIERFKEFVLSKPDDLNCYINEKILPEARYAVYHDFKWFVAKSGNDEKLEHLAETLLGLVKEYDDAKKYAVDAENYAEAEYYSKQVKLLRKGKVLESLSKYCVIPKYGFPVDVVELQIYNEGILDNRYDLNRDLRIAISEYAPDSEVIVDGKKYISKYITLPRISGFPRHYFVTCPTCTKVNVFVSTHTAEQCKYCGQSITDQKVDFFIEPIHGFKTGVVKESTRMKPKRSYAGEVSYLGGGLTDQYCLDFGDVIQVETRTDDELLVMNRSRFYVCPACGYSDITKGNVFPKISQNHKNYRQYDCGNDELELMRIGHRFQTDVARLTIPLLSSTEKDSHSKALSFMYAFLEGVSNALGIERTDIDSVLELNLAEQSYDLLLYDNVPGGAGHVKRLVSNSAIVDSLIAARKIVSQDCCDENTSCYNCLRNYYNQAVHSRLQRRYAIDYIDLLLNEISYQK